MPDGAHSGQSDFTLFVGQLLKKPHQVVALAPSSVGLCTEMVSGLAPDAGPVIELGAGTGRITRAILGRGIRAENLHSIDTNAEFCAHLRMRFAGLNVYQRSAGDTDSLPVEGAQAVISGLPLLSMPLDLQHAILAGSFDRLAPDGVYVQFTYGPKPPVARQVREALGLRWDVSPKIWWNLPPARVYRFRRG